MTRGWSGPADAPDARARADAEGRRTGDHPRVPLEPHVCRAGRCAHETMALRQWLGGQHRHIGLDGRPYVLRASPQGTALVAVKIDG